MKRESRQLSHSTIERSGRAFLYLRVSTERQADEGFSLGEQESRLRGYAQSVGLPVAGVFIDAGVSGSKRLQTRPKGAELLAAVRHGDHVIASKLDRLFRSATDALNVAESLRAQGVRLHLLDLGGEVTGTGAAKLVFSVLAAVSEMERTRIGERVRNVKQHLRDGGYFTGGKLARGYHVTDDGKLIPDAHWNECRAFMSQLHSAGVSYRTIAQQVNERFSVAIDFSTVYRILNGKRELDRSAANITQQNVPNAASPDAKPLRVEPRIIDMDDDDDKEPPKEPVH